MSFYHTFRFWTLITLLSIVLGTAASLSGLVDRTGNLAHRVSRLWCRLLCEWNGIDVELIGMENVQRDRAQIFVANHQGFFDIFAMSGYLPVQIRWVAKSSLFRIPFVGWAMKASGYISVERGDRKKSYQSFIETVEKVKSGCSVVVFPEGTRSEDGTIGPFKKGSHLLAVRSSVPMIPVTIIGTKDIIPKGSGTIQPGPVRIIFSPPVQIAPSDSKKGEGVLESIRDTICKTYSKNLARNERLKHHEITPDTTIANEKLTRYLLLPQARGDKSAFLGKAGYTLGNANQLALDLHHQILLLDATELETNQFGKYYEIRGSLTGPNGVMLYIRTIWITERLSGNTKFVTLIPDKRRTR